MDNEKKYTEEEIRTKVEESIRRAKEKLAAGHTPEEIIRENKELTADELEQVGGGVIPVPENRSKRPKFSKKEYMEQEKKAQQAVNDLLGGGVDIGVQMGLKPDPDSQDGKEDGNA